MTRARGLVSVMMPAYNAESYIAQAIESVLTQTYTNWELLVVNDGATDGTAEVAARFTDPRIRLFNKPNGGESSARNVALDHSRGEFIAYLDADDAYLPHHLAITVGYLTANPQRDAVYTDGTHMDEHGRQMTTLQSRRRGPFEGRLFEEVVRASDVFGPPMCVVLRHDLVLRHQLRYDPRIVIGPDWDFFTRYAERATFGYLPDRTGLYRVHSTNITAKVDGNRRAGYMAICREKAIKLDGFHTCSLRTRTEVFYDLLVNLLRGQSGRRAAVMNWPQFTALPAVEQARLIRLTAADAIVRDGENASEWLARARRLNPADTRVRLMAMLSSISPALCRAVLRASSSERAQVGRTGPFADLDEARLSAAAVPAASPRGER